MAYGLETVPAQTPQAVFKNATHLGRFAELGGSLELYGNWVPARVHGDNDDPYTAAARIMAVAGHLENTRLPLEDARQIAIRDTREHFDKEEAPPGGTPWEQLSDTPPGKGYKTQKAEYAPDTKILELTGELADIAASEQTWIIIGETLVFDPMALPEYGPIHQKGRGAEVEFEFGGETYQSGAMPARPFIGLSREAILEIAATFEAWFAEAEVIGGFFRPGGYQNIIRTPHGPRFTKMQ